MTRQQYRQASWLGLVMTGAVAGCILALRHFGGVELPLWARAAIIAAALGGGLLFTVAWWRLLDEVAREAHKFAWYWGGSAGMAVAGAVMILVDSDRISVPHFVLPGEHGDFAAGVATVLLAQVIGYGIAWVGWWWSHR